MRRAFHAVFFLASALINSCAPAVDNVEEAVIDKAKEEAKHQRLVALYADADHSAKCEAVFRELRERLRPGMTSAEASRSLGRQEWMRQTKSDQVTILGGWIPVDIGFGKRAFWMNLYPNADGWSNYTVYFSIECPETHMEGFTIGQYLSGEVHSKDVRLHQFALGFPGTAPNDMGRYEIIPKPKSEQAGDGDGE